MALVRIACSGVKTISPQVFFFEASLEVTITQAEHGLDKVPHVAVYDTAGHEVETEVQVNATTFEVNVRQESPAIAIYVALN